MQRFSKNVNDKKTQEVFDFIFRNAMGNPIILDAAPSASQMKANTWGYYGTDLYVRFADGTCLKFTGTEVS